MQIDTTNNQVETQALHKEAMKIRAAEFMSKDSQKKSIQNLLTKQHQRFDVNLDDLRQFSPDLARYVAKNPIEAISMFEQQLDRIVQDYTSNQKGDSEKTALQTDKAFPTKVKKYYVNFEGNFGQNHVTPRGLKASLVNQYVSVQGIVTRMSIVRPKMQTSVHYCEVTKKGLVKHYADDTNLAQLSEDAVKLNDGNFQFPVKDKDNNPLSAEFGYCVYKDCQIITI